MRGEGLFWNECKLRGVYGTLSLAERVAIIGLMHFAPGGFFYARANTVAAWAEVSCEVIFRAIRVLLSSGLLEKVEESDGRSPARYRFILDTDAKKAPVTPAVSAAPAVSGETEQLCPRRQSPLNPHIRKSSKLLSSSANEALAAAAQELALELKRSKSKVLAIMEKHGEALVMEAMKRLRRRRNVGDPFAVLLKILDEDRDELLEAVERQKAKTQTVAKASKAIAARCEDTRKADQEYAELNARALKLWQGMDAKERKALVHEVAQTAYPAAAGMAHLRATYEAAEPGKAVPGNATMQALRERVKTQ